MLDSLIFTVGDLSYAVQFVRTDMLRLRIGRSPIFRSEEKEMVVASLLPYTGFDVEIAPSAMFLKTDSMYLQISRYDGNFTLADSMRREILSSCRNPGWHNPVLTSVEVTGDYLDDGTNSIRTGCDSASWDIAGSAFILSLKYTPHERFYGLGISADYMDLRGRVIDTGTDRYQADDLSTPYFWSSAGYGILVRTSRAVRYDIGVTDTDMVTLWVGEDEEFECFIQSGSTEECLDGYAWLTGQTMQYRNSCSAPG